MRFKNWFSLLIFLALVLLIEWVGHILTIHSVGSWYLTLHKPAWNPPGWVFAPVWTILYVTIGISGWLIFIKMGSFQKNKSAFLIYGVQLFFNVLWSYFFFYLKSPFLALLCILVLLSMILVNIMSFLKIYRPAAFLLVPYFIWTVFAAVLNAAIWSLNR